MHTLSHPFILGFIKIHFLSPASVEKYLIHYCLSTYQASTQLASNQIIRKNVVTWDVVPLTPWNYSYRPSLSWIDQWESRFTLSWPITEEANTIWTLIDPTAELQCISAWSVLCHVNFGLHICNLHEVMKCAWAECFQACGWLVDPNLLLSLLNVESWEPLCSYTSSIG